MHTFTHSFGFLLLALGICSLPWVNAGPVPCDSERTCSKLFGRSSVSLTSNFSKPQDLINAERQKRLPSKPPTHILARQDGNPATVPKVTYTGVIQVLSGSTSLGYVAPNPDYWTPLLTPNIPRAVSISFQLDNGTTSGSRLALTELNDNRHQFFAPVVGRDSTSSNIAPRSFNYLYLESVALPGTAPGARPQSVPSYFSTSSGLDKQAETHVWSVNTVTGALTLQWINTDGTTPSTSTFVQSNLVYAGGDPNAFYTEFPVTVIAVTLKFIPTV